MKSVFTTNLKRTQFPPPTTNISIILSFNEMISKLTPHRSSSIQIINAYKEYILKLKNNPFTKEILLLIESLLKFYTMPPIDMLAFTSFIFESSVPLTIEPLYLKYLQGEPTNITDPVILSILNEIKSKNNI